ncbi:MAG TPA: AAA family ATPase [Anaerolineae bacterium]|nr:AAA family ATPase [Anaerolineae bacterium]
MSETKVLAADLVANLRRLNPWWSGNPQIPLPPVRRWAFPLALRRLVSGPTKATVLSGPRQVGKSTLVQQIIQSLLLDGVAPTTIFYVQFEQLPGLIGLREPILRLADWFEQTILGSTFNQSALSGRPVYLFLDEVQNLADWAAQLKLLVDSSAVRVMVTGSSALRIEQGRDSLAGRISTLEMGPLFLREIAEIRGEGRVDAYLPANGLAPLKDKDFWLGLRQFGLDHRQLRDQAFQAFAQRGAYPVAHAYPDTRWEELADLLNETVIWRAIQHDLRLGPRGAKRDEHLLEEVFRLACRYIGQSPRQSLYLDEVRRVMEANIGWQRILAYLRFLDATLLIRLIEPLELRLKRSRGASKLCLCDHALRASWLQEVVPLDAAGLQQNPHLHDLAGRIAESAAGYFLRSISGLDVAHFPERAAEPEVDYVLTVGEQRIPVEIKYRSRVSWEDTRGLRSFVERSAYNAPFGVLVTMSDDSASDDPRLVHLPLSTLLLMR